VDKGCSPRLVAPLAGAQLHSHGPADDEEPALSSLVAMADHFLTEVAYRQHNHSVAYLPQNRSVAMDADPVDHLGSLGSVGSLAIGFLSSVVDRGHMLHH